MRCWIIILMLFTTVGISAQNSIEKRLEGDTFYDNKEYESAQKAYQEAYDIDPSSTTAYNLGNTLYEQGDFEGASAQYEIAQANSDEQLRADAYYNQGNAFFKSQKYAEAVEAYKQSLKLDDTDLSAKQNLLRAKQQLKIQQQQQQQQEGESQENNQENQDESQEQKDQSQGNQEQNEEDQQSQGQQNNESDKKQQDGGSSEPIENKELNKSEAEKLLEIAESEENKTKSKMHRAQSSDRDIEKDW